MNTLLDPANIEAFCLYLVRTSMLVVASPLLGQTVSSSGTKIALTVILATVAFSAGGTPLDAPVAAPILAVMALREALIGFFLAFTVQMGMLVIRVMGEMLSLEMGLQMASQVDPVSGQNSPLVTRIYEGLAILGLLAIDAHHWIVQSLVDSFDRAPIGGMSIELGVSEFVVTLFGEAIRAGIAFAAPFMIIMMMVSVLLGLLARTVTQINVLDLGFTLRVGMAQGVMILLAPLLGPLFGDVFQRLRSWIGLGLEALGG